jgi:hypothetical protein
VVIYLISGLKKFLKADRRKTDASVLRLSSFSCIPVSKVIVATVTFDTGTQLHPNINKLAPLERGTQKLILRYGVSERRGGVKVVCKYSTNHLQKVHFPSKGFLISSV